MRLEEVGFERNAEPSGRIQAGRVDLCWVTACVTWVTVLGSASTADAGSGRRRNTREPVGYPALREPARQPDRADDGAPRGHAVDGDARR